MAPSSPPAVVCDAGPLIHLDELDCADLLADFPRCLIAPAVWREVQNHRPDVLSRTDIIFEKSDSPPEQPSVLEALSSAFELHPGERQALALALIHRHALFLTDDTPARLAATSLELSVHGSLGILVRAIRRNQRTKDQILATLQAIPKRSTLHIRPTLLEHVIQTVRSSS